MADALSGDTPSPSSTPRVTHPSPPPSNRFSRLIADQKIALVDSFTLESGVELHDVQVAYKTWGKLNADRDNCMVICHALTGSADVEDWWGPMMGRGLAFDPSRYFIFCANVLGSPYGTSSPVTINPSTGQRWGPEFPLVTVRDDVRLHRIILDHLGVKSLAAVIGGSMGGMQVLEWSLMTERGYVRNIVPIATSAHHSAWGISWGEAQRQAIYCDPLYEEGYYEDEHPPASGLSAARMAALLTYRSRDSFESRFGRREMESRQLANHHSSSSRSGINGAGSSSGSNGQDASAIAAGSRPSSSNSTAAHQARQAHNDGYRGSSTFSSRKASTSSLPTVADLPSAAVAAGEAGSGGSSGTVGNASSSSSSTTTTTKESMTGASKRPLVYSAQSYLRYQGDKFISRFDANCYISITRKMDSHDVCRARSSPHQDGDHPSWHPLNEVPPHALVLAISSDALFTLDEQRLMVSKMPEARLIIVESPEGHDGFLLEFEQINKHIIDHLEQRLPEIYAAEPLLGEDVVEDEGGVEEKYKFQVKKDSLFGEAEADVTAW